MEPKVNGKRSGRRKKKAKIRKDRKRDRKSKSAPCEDNHGERNSENDLFATRPIASPQRLGRPVPEQGIRKLTGPSPKQTTTRGIRMADSGEDFSRASQSETERLTELITAIFDAATSEVSGKEPSPVTGVSGDNVDQGKLASSEDSEELLELTDKFNKSLRWRASCDNPEDEETRMKRYKMNRRKRYLVESLRDRQDKEGVLAFAKELAMDEEF